MVWMSLLACFLSHSGTQNEDFNPALWLLFLNHFEIFSHETLKKDHKQDRDHVIINNKVINLA